MHASFDDPAPNWFIAFKHVSPKKKKKFATRRGDKRKTEDTTAITSPIINTTNCPGKCCMKALRIHNNMAYKFCAKLSTLAGASSHLRCNNRRSSSNISSSSNTWHSNYFWHRCNNVRHKKSQILWATFIMATVFSSARFWPAAQQQRACHKQQQQQQQQQSQQQHNANTKPSKRWTCSVIFDLILATGAGKSVILQIGALRKNRGNQLGKITKVNTYNI